MTMFDDARELVRSIVFTSFDKLRSRGYYQEEIYIILLALYAYKTKEDDKIKRELLDCTFRVLGEDADAIVEITEELQKVNHDLYLEVYPSVVDEVIEHVFVNNSKTTGEHALPKNFVSLLCKLVMQSKLSTVYNPFAGYAAIPLSLSGVECYSQEMFNRYHAIGMVLLDAHGYDTSTYTLSDAFQEWNPSQSECVVSFPPFGVPYQKRKGEKTPVRTSEEFVFWKFSRSVESYAVYVVPNSFCFGSISSTQNLRKELIESNYLDMVISLPAGLLANTGISTSIIVLKKSRTDKEPVKFFDAREMYISKNKREKELDIDAIADLIENPADECHAFVNREEICHNDYRWNVDSYISRKFEIFPDGYHVVELNDIVETISLNRHFDEAEGHMVMITQLSSDVEGYYRTPDSFELSSDIQKCSKLEEPALLLSTIGVLKPTFCPASPENPVFLHPHVRAFRIKASWANPAYLCLQLSKSKGYSVGVFVPHINVKDILRIRIAFPTIGTQKSFEEQGRLYNESIESAKLAKAKEMGLQEVIDKMKAEYINVIRTRKHDMRPYVRELDSAEMLMRHYLSKMDNIADFKMKMDIVLDQYHLALSKLSELIEIFSEEEEFGKSEPFNIDKYFFEMKNNQDAIHSGYIVEYYCDDNALQEYGLPYHKNFNKVLTVEDFKSYYEDQLKGNKYVPLIVEIAPLDFERLVRNIVENAKVHGFTNPNRIDYTISIVLSVVPEKNMFQIDISNNGIPLPAGMDKNRFGLLGEKAGVTGRTGRGGYVVKSIVEHYHGDYDVFMDGDNTVVRILLPISKDSFEYEQI